MCDSDSDSRSTQKFDSNSDSDSNQFLIFLIPIPIPIPAKNGIIPESIPILESCITDGKLHTCWATHCYASFGELINLGNGSSENSH